MSTETIDWLPKLEPGTRCYDLSGTLFHGVPGATQQVITREEVCARMNAMLESVNEQGGQVVGMMTKLALKPGASPAGIDNTELVTFVVIHKDAG